MKFAVTGSAHSMSANASGEATDEGCFFRTPLGCGWKKPLAPAAGDQRFL